MKKLDFKYITFRYNSSLKYKNNYDLFLYILSSFIKYHKFITYIIIDTGSDNSSGGERLFNLYGAAGPDMQESSHAANPIR